MNEQLLSLVTQYGPPALLGIVAIAALGVPLPITLLLIVVGSMVSQGVMDVWLAVAAASIGSILGDNAGYAIGRFGGAAAIDKLSGLIGRKAGVEAMEARARAWGGPGIFLTRWLFGPLGPWINLASGTAGYPWLRFLFWDVLGEVTSAVLYISLGRVFSDQVLALDGVLGDMTWALLAGLVAVVLGYQLWRRLRKHPSE